MFSEYITQLSWMTRMMILQDLRFQIDLQNQPKHNWT